MRCLLVVLFVLLLGQFATNRWLARPFFLASSSELNGAVKLLYRVLLMALCSHGEGFGFCVFSIYGATRLDLVEQRWIGTSLGSLVCLQKLVV